ncbi:hypothetical protein CWT12_01635 [Actinomyces sp. 432]|uniref:hypothetical protein n=1 Tax=Actinomyces sp. 432 TaxID=2057798 RepID=UPI001373CE30|nr:hypothetical protein [Actinomyces sp. 432]QHO90302.1 hypothetical protein CWT12_01635 [Actinomyces sp. 432]
MSFKALAWAMKVRGVRPMDRLVLVSVADNAQPDGVAIVDLDRLAEQVEVSSDTLAKCFARLSESGLLSARPAGPDAPYPGTEVSLALDVDGVDRS